MQYLLVENKQTIHLGPTFWRHRFIQSELDDIGVVFTVPPVEPNGHLKITDTVEIFPVSSLYTPNHDSTYEQLSGPFWLFTDTEATGIYSVVQKPLETIKSELKALAAAERYKREVAGAKAIIQDQEVFVDTSRDGRNIFVQKYAMMSDTDTVKWKFPEMWLTLTKSELGQIIAAGAAYVQSQFDWESGIIIQIDAANFVEQLKQITIVETAAQLGVA